MTRHGGDLLVELLIRYGVPVVFGLAGGQTLPLYDAIRSRGGQIRHLPMRDERSAAYAADGYARVSRRVGVCDATVGPGAIKLASGLAEAMNSSIPLVALVSDMPSTWLAVRYRGGGNQLVDQMAALRPLCKWTGRLPNETAIPELVHRAFQMATSERPGPVAIELPEDLFKSPCPTDTPEVDARFSAAPAFRPSPDPQAASEAVDLLARARAPVVVAGGGVILSDAGAALKALAERLALPVATSLTGKGAIAETHPLALGVLGALGGAAPARQLVEEADVILAVGFKFGQNPTFTWTLPAASQRIIHLDIDPAEIGKIFPTEVGLVADARSGLEGMLSACKTRRAADEVIRRIAELRKSWRSELIELAREAKPLRPQQVVSVINELAGPEDILVCDASFASGWGGMYFAAHDDRRAIFPRGMGGLGWGLPAAIGAKIARPHARVVVLAGDGAMSYCLGELATLVQEGLDITVVVLNNSAMGWIKWEQAVYWEGNFQSTDLSDVDFAAVARGLGCLGMRVEEPDQLREAIAWALASDSPALVDVRTAASEAALAKFTESETAAARMERTRSGA